MPFILNTKLYIPPLREKAVDRSRLFHKLSVALSRPLTLISAPAGFGKSTLISGWIEQNRDRNRFSLTWFSLDGEDNDPERFLAYLGAAFSRLQEGIGEQVLALLDASQRPGPRALLNLLIRDLAGFSKTGVLVLDDYHTITNPEIHDLMGSLIAGLPPDMHIIISTRADPPLPLARLRVNDRLVEIRAADLLFSPEEMNTFLIETMELSISNEAAARMAARTEGWAAGLQLAALASRASSERSGGLAHETTFRGEHPYLRDYLLEEVLAHLPDGHVAFLLRTSLLEELCGPLCDAVLDNQESGSKINSAQVLDTLYRANMFLIPLGFDDVGRQWFRYHHLFAESLSTRLKQMDGARVHEQTLRAARWYAGEGRVEDAIRYALAGGAVEQAAAWIEIAASAYLKNGQAAPVQRWLSALPDDLLRSRPRLAMIWARVLYMIGDFEPAKTELDRLEQRIIHVSDPDSQLMLGEVYAVRAAIAGVQGDSSRAISGAHKALALLPETNFHWRALASLSLGNAYLISGDYQAADEPFGNAIHNGLLAENYHIVFTAVTNQAEARTIRGLLCEAQDSLQHGLHIIQDLATRARRAIATPTASLVYCGLAEISIERRDLAAAEKYIQQALDLADQGGFVVAVISALAAQAHLELARGTPERGLDSIEQAVKTIHGPQAQALAGLLQAYRMRIQLAMGELNSVERSLEELVRDSGNVSDYLSEVNAILQLRLYRARGHTQRGLDLGFKLLAAAEEDQRLGRALEIRLQIALMHQQSGDQSAAMAALHEALRFGAPRGYCGTFVEAGEGMRALMQALHRSLPVEDPLRVSARRILESFRSSEHDTGMSNQQLVEPLSDRELEVLRLVASGASNQQIANQLIVSTGTVKSHVHHIQGKLGTSSRVALVQRAKDLGLV